MISEAYEDSCYVIRESFLYDQISGHLYLIPIKKEKKEKENI